MNQERHRTKIDIGIYRDCYGLAATVKVEKLQREKRFPLDASIRAIKNWQEETRVALRKIAPTAERGTFAKDGEWYLRASCVHAHVQGTRETHRALDRAVRRPGALQHHDRGR